MEVNTKLPKALAAAQSGMSNATLNRDNPHFKSRYADLAAIRDATVPALAKNGLSITQYTAMRDGTLMLFTRLLHESGEFIESEWPLPNAFEKPQLMGSAVTYAKRYSWSAIVGISAEDDDDGNAAGSNQGGVQSKKAPPKKAPEKPALKPEDVVIAEGFWSGASYKVTAGTAADFATTLIAYTQAGSKAGGLSALDKLWDDNKAFIDRIREAAPDEYARYMTELNGVRGVLLTQRDADQLEAAE